MTAVRDAAISALEHHLSVVPPSEDGSKKPLGLWKKYQKARPDLATVEGWYSGDRHGIGIVCGAVSENLEMFEFEGIACAEGMWDRYKERAAEMGHGDLLRRLITGYSERTPSGGIHFLYRCEEISGNLKLARRPNTTNPKLLDTLIETRGEGGYAIVSPSSGPVHDSGIAWRIVKGGFDSIPTISAAERAALHDIAREFNECGPDPEPEHDEPEPNNGISAADIDRLVGWAGDSWMDATVAEFNCTHTWENVLDGWVKSHVSDGVVYWVRPGKDEGHSATTNANGTDRLIVFSSSVAGFEAYDGITPPTSYDRFSAWAIIHHQGDRVAAARAFRPPVGATPTVEIPAPTEAPQEAAHAVEVNAFVAEDEPDYDWLVENLFERGDRLILTGPEGGGKSTLQRQMGVQIASGIHPFTHEDIPARRVLIVDLENGKRQIKRKLNELLSINAPEIGMLWVAPRPQGLNLSQFEDQSWLVSVIKQTNPDFLMIGPLYKLNDGDPTEEKVAKPVAVLLDRLREAFGFCLILEAHTPHSQNGSAKRPMRPYGASLWLRWPEFGLHLSPEGMLHHWRGPRDERAWPTLLARGGNTEWPWVVPSDRNARFHDILQACRDAGRALSIREITEVTGIAKSTVSRAIAANAEQWDQMVAGLEGEEF
ncbi:MAG: hypothetical protein NVS9B11_18310 [Candidatus Dormibacteraceae bacterium]